VGSEAYTNDQLGQITQAQKVISSTTYTTGYEYNLAGGDQEDHVSLGAAGATDV